MSAIVKPCITALAYGIIARSRVLLKGEPGTAKTAIIGSMVRAMRRHLETIIASIREPSDFGGLPIVTNGSYTRCPDSWAYRLAKHEDPVWFIDEISTTPPAVQAALLRAVFDLVVGDFQLPAGPFGTSVVAACNPVEQAAGGWDLAAPLANRFVHLPWSLDVEYWADGLAAGAWPDAVVPTVPEDWELTHGPVERAAVAAFLKRAPHLAQVVPEDEESQGGAWPSFRSWTELARLQACSTAGGANDDVKQMLAIGCVGEEAMTFFEWRSALDLPDPEDLLANADTCDLTEYLTRGDKAYVVMAGVAQAATKMSKGAEAVDRWERGWRVLSRAYDQGTPDVAASACRTLAIKVPRDDNDEMAFAPVEAGKFAVLLQKAGLMAQVRQ